MWDLSLSDSGRKAERKDRRGVGKVPAPPPSPLSNLKGSP